MNDFASLGVLPPLVRAVVELGYEEPTPIQEAAIPAILAGRDVRGLAQTGTGKTAAFVLPILQKLYDPKGAVRAGRSRPVRALVVAPTRELAAQIGDAMADCSLYLAPAPKICVVFGGLSINPQMMELRGGADIVVGTPGRLLDLVEQNALHLSDVEVLVLDEADRLLSLGFADEIARLLALIGGAEGKSQRLLFSATFPPAVRTLSESLLRAPLQIDTKATASGDELPILQRAIAVDAPRRTMLLRHLIETHSWSRVLVFVASRYTADRVVDKLQRAKIAAAAIHGGLSQGARSAALTSFKATRVQVLVATDLAGRGIDIEQLGAVVNYDLPRSPVDYVHRIGRTARAGETGTAVSFVNADTETHFQLIEKRHRIRLERERIPGFEPTDLAPTAPVRDPHGGIKGKRKSKKDKLREAAALEGKAKGNA